MSYELIETVTIGAGGSASVSFASIPQDGTDLCILVSGRTDFAAYRRSFNLTYNGAGYTSAKTIYADGALINSTTSLGNNSTGATATANTFSDDKIYISNYTSATIKPMISLGAAENNASSGWINFANGTTATAAAITEVSLAPNAANWVEGTTVSLYKIY